MQVVRFEILYIFNIHETMIKECIADSKKQLWMRKKKELQFDILDV